MKSLLIKKAMYAGSYFFLALLIEFLTFTFMGIGLFPSYYWLDIAVIFLISAVIFILPGFTFEAIVIFLLLFVQILISVANESLYNMSGFVFNLNMLNLLFEVGGVFNNDFINLPLLVSLVFIIIAECAFLFSLRKFRCTSSMRLQTIVLLLFVFCLSSGLSVMAYFLQTESFAQASADDELYIYKDDSYLYDTQFLSAKAFRKFGTFSFYIKNIENFLDSFTILKGEKNEEEKAKKKEELDEFFDSGIMSSELDDLDLSAYGGNENIRTGMLDGQNIVLIVIESGEWYAINKRYTPTLYALADQGIAMTEYYARDKTNHSEAMSILGSYPSELENSIAPSINNPQGLLEHDFAFTLPDILQDNNYTTNYFHANSGAFYKREDTHGELYGFDHSTFKESMERIKNYNVATNFYDMPRDSEVFSQYAADYMRVDEGDSAFFTMMMTLTSHGAYEDLVNNGDYTASMSEAEKEEFSDRVLLKNLETYYERINGYPESTDHIAGTDGITATLDIQDRESYEVYLRYKRYQASIMDLDVGINRLIHELDEAGELSNTTFVFYADHNAYYSNQHYALKSISPGAKWDTALYNIPFFIWSGKNMSLQVDSDLYDGEVYYNDEVDNSIYDGAFYYTIDHSVEEDVGGLKLTKFCNSFDILPTLLDLLGFEYNLNIYQGISVLDDAQSVFVSRESGLFTDEYYYDGDYIYLMADVDADGSVRSRDGSVVVYGADAAENVWRTASVKKDGVMQTYSWTELNLYLKVVTYEDRSYIVYDFDRLVTSVPDPNTGILTDNRQYLSDDVQLFLDDTIGYFYKQKFLEEMYSIDYFGYEDVDFSLFVKKI